VETVGVGHFETGVADLVGFFLVVLIAGTGDELQDIKARAAGDGRFGRDQRGRWR